MPAAATRQGMTVVRFEPRGAARDAMRSHAPMIIVSGAAGTGKSVPLMMKLHLVCMSVPKVRCLVIRKTLTSLTASTLVSFRNRVAAEALAAGVVKFYGGSPQEPAAFRYRNGSVIVVGGADKSARFLSTEYDLVFADEAVELTAEDIDTVDTRLRNGVLPYQQFLMATNPGPPSHHLKRRADEGRATMLFSQHEDNPLLYRDGEWTAAGQTYLARLDRLTGVRHQRLRKGLWVAAEGIVYDDFDDAVHVIDRFQVPDSWTRWMSVDFGFTNPLVVQWWAQDPDGRLYLYREIYRTRTLVEDHVKEIRRLVMDGAGGWREPRPRAIVCDHDAEDRATLERHLGMSTMPAPKKVNEGIQAVQERLRVAGDGRPRLFLMRDSLTSRDTELEEARKPTCTLEEVHGYVWDIGEGKPPKETPIKQDDHGMDALRYVVAAVDLAPRPRVRMM